MRRTSTTRQMMAITASSTVEPANTYVQSAGVRSRTKRYVSVRNTISATNAQNIVFE